MNARFVVLAIGAALGLVAACGDLKSGDTSDHVEGGSDETDATTDSGRGPGPHGSLPTGFCCTSDAECRFRHCDTVGTQKMCIEECDNPDYCSRPDLKGFTCAASAAGGERCAPPAGFTCLDPSTFVRGTLPVGACCNGGYEGTNDGTAASACEGNDCTGTGTGPLVCTIVCAFQSDCPSGFKCALSGNLKLCVRPTSDYTCE